MEETKKEAGVKSVHWKALFFFEQLPFWKQIHLIFPSANILRLSAQNVGKK